MEMRLAVLARLWLALILLRFAAFVAGGEAFRTIDPEWTDCWEPAA